LREFVLTATDSIDLYDVEHLVDLGLELEASTSSGRAGAVGMLQAILQVIFTGSRACRLLP